MRTRRDLVAIVLLAASVAGLWAVWSWLRLPHAEEGSANGSIQAVSAAASSISVVLDAVEPQGQRTVAAAEPEKAPPVPLIVAGRVVDQFGDPVVGAGVSIVRGTAKESGRIELNGLHRSSTSTANGTFVFRADEGAEDRFLMVRKDGYFPLQPIPFEHGKDGLVVVLRRCGTISGRVIADPGVPLESVEIALFPIARSQEVPESVPPSVREVLHEPAPIFRKPSGDGRFSFEGVCAEQARLEFTVTGLDLRIAGLESVRVQEVDGPADPRLDPIDLRSGLRLLTITVADDQGEKRDDALVVVRGQGPGDKDRGQTTSDGRATFLVRPGPCDVDVELLGYRREHLYGIEADSTVQLRAGIPVRVRVGGSGELPLDPSRLRVAALVAVESPLTAVDGVGDVGSTREAVFRVSSPGAHEIAWYLDEKFLVGTPRQTIGIYESESGDQVIDVFLGPEVEASWRQALRDMEKR